MIQESCKNCPRYKVSGDNIVKPLHRRGSSILLVSAEPESIDLKYNTPFSNKTGLIIKKLLYNISIDLGLGDNIFSYTNAVLCASEEHKLDAHTITCCSTQLKQTIDTIKPQYIIAFGIEVVKALGINTSKLANVRGTIIDLPSNKNIKVVPTFGFKVISTVAGKLPVLEQDLRKACSLVADSKQVDTLFKYKYDTNVDDICNTLQVALNYIENKHSNTGKKVLVALDTETNSNQSYKEDSKIIAISMCWDKEFGGYAYPYKHKDCIFNDTELDRIATLTKKIILHPHVSLTLANGKFDYGFLAKEKLGNIKPDWDVLLGEHCLDEDKTGEYSLKVLTTDYFPEVGKYADELHAEDERIDNELAIKVQEKIDSIKLGYGYHIFTQLLNIDKQLINDDLEKIQLNTIPLPRVLKKACSIYKDIISSSDIIVNNDNKQILCDGEQKYETVIISTSLAVICLAAYSLYAKKNIDTCFRGYGQDLSINIDTIKKFESQKNFELYNLPVLLKYAAIDAVATYNITERQVIRFQEDTDRIDNIFKRELTPVKIPSLYNVMFKHAMPLSRAISAIEYGGVPLDIPKINSIIPSLEQQENTLLKSIISEVGYDLNINSTPQLVDLVYNKLQLPVEAVTKSGAPSVDEDTLIKLANNHDIQILKNIIELRKIRKVKDTYLSSWLNLSRFDNKLHASFNIIGTATGRLSCSEPNLQNVPAYLAGINMKSIFIPEDDTYTIIDCDIANAEMRVLCAYSKDPDLINAFNNNIDLHTLTASKLAEGIMTYDEIAMHKEDKTHFAYAIRQVAKKINFGVIYGISKYGIARDQRKELIVLLNHRYETKELTAEQIDELHYKMGLEIFVQSVRGKYTELPPRDKLISMGFEEAIVNLAQELIDSFYTSYPQVGNYVKYTQNFLERYYVALTYTGRRRRFDLSRYSKEALAKAKRQSINSRIQGTSSDIVMTNLIGIHNMLEYTQLGRILLTVHDSICFQFKKEYIQLVKPMLDAIIVNWTAKRYPWLPVKWKYDAASGPNYGDCHTELAASDKSFIELCNDANIQMNEDLFEKIMNM